MPFVIPPLLAVTLGLIGSVAVVRWVAGEARRVNAKLNGRASDKASEHYGPKAKLKRDPVSGVYRPE